MSAPDVSIIVPFWGVEDTLGECLQSIVAQDHLNLEVICVDDASEDGSRGIAERHASSDARVRIIEHDVNRGLGMARNTGVAEAKGEFFLFLDSDDRLSSQTAVRSLLQAAVETRSAMVTGRAVYLGPDGTTTPFDLAAERRHSGPVVRNLTGPAAYSALIRRPGANFLPLRSWGYLFNTEFYRELEFLHPSGVHEDIGHNALVASAARNVHYSEDVIVDYRVRPGSLSNSPWSAQKMESYLGVWRHFRDSHARFGLKDMVGNAALHVVRNCCWMLRKHSVRSGDEVAIVDRIGSVLEDVDSGADDEMLIQVVVLLYDILRHLKMPPGSLSRLLARLPVETHISLAYQGLGLRRHFRPSAPVS